MTTAAARIVDPSAVSSASTALRAGRPVLIRDTTTGGGNVVIAAALADVHWTSWAVRWTSGFLCAPMPDALADALDLPVMTRQRTGSRSPAFTVAVDAASGTTTGISAHDRAHTARTLADPRSSPTDLIRPGHLVPVRIGDNDLVSRPDRMAASVALCKAAGLPPVALVGELVTDAGSVLSSKSVADFSSQHGLSSLTVDAVLSHRLLFGDGSAPRVVPTNHSSMRTVHGDLDSHAYLDTVTGLEHLVLRGAGTATVPTVSIHVECKRSNVFRALDCECSIDLWQDVHRYTADGGMMIYLGRPSHETAHTCSSSDVSAAAAILHQLGATTVRLDGGRVSASSLSNSGITVIGNRSTAPEES